MYNLFFELLQVAIGRRDALSSSLSDVEWREVMECAKKQALMGICFAGVERLPADQRPPRELILTWYTIVQQIEKRNWMLNTRSVEACRYFERQGFMACVLKGQGNAAMYVVSDKGIDLRQRRQSGDIDIWCIAPNAMRNEKCKINDSRSVVLKWARARYPKEEYDLKHIHFPIIQNVPIEVHFVPSRLRAPIANHRLTRFYEREALTQMQHSVKLEGVDEGLGSLVCPTTEFNLVFQLTHIFNHYLTEGVGLRQVMDYFFLLQEAKEESETDNGNCKMRVLEDIKGIGLYGFLQALMWVLHEALGMKEEEMPCPMDERKGRVLMDEILAGGNFGHYESRYWYQGMSRWKFYLARMRRMLHFLRYYPASVLWDIPSRIKQRVWMMRCRRSRS
jgi:hypothetical protein